MTRSAMTLCSLLLLLFLVHQGRGDDPIVTITETDPKVDRAGDMVVSLSDMAQLTCVVENKPRNVEVKWVRFTPMGNTILISTATASTDPHKYSVDNPSPTAWRLRIQSLQVTDEGTYACRVQVVAQNYVDDMRYLKVVESPQIADLQTSSDMTVKEGDPVQLKCNATGRPFPIVKWMRLAGELLPSGGQELMSYTLNIPQAKPEHRGYYMCISENKAGRDARRIFLSVKFYPRVHEVSPIVSQKVGYRKQLKCDVRAFPVPEVSAIAWTRNDMPIQSDGHYMIKSIKGASSRISSTLTINPVRTGDYGLYKCSAKNTEGEGVGKIELSSSDVVTEQGPGYSGAAVHSISMTTLALSTLLLLLSVWLLH